RQRGRSRREPRDVERAPRAIAGAERAQQRQVEDVHAGLIDVVEVAVRHVALADAPGNVMHHRRVLDEGPRQRPHQQHGDQHADPRDDDAAERPRTHQIVLGKRYRCWSSPSTPRGISSTTAMMIAPNSSGWTYG